MAKPKQKKDERKLKLKRLKEYKIGSDIQGYAEYVEKMTRVDALMDKYSVPNAFGAAETMDLKAKEALLKAMQEAAMAGEEYMKNAQAAKEAGTLKDLKHGVPMIVNGLQGMLNRDQEILEQYDPSVPQSLPRVLGDARSSIVFLDKDQMQKLGGAQNSRIPITFKDNLGVERRGMFTKANFAEDYDQMVNDLLERAAAQCYIPKGKTSIRGMIETYRERNRERLGKATDAQIFQELSKILIQEGDRWGTRAELKEDALEKELGIEKGTLGFEGKKAIREAFEIYSKLTSEKVSPYMNGGVLGMRKGERIDNLNSAMSAVTKLLGAPDLIANSVNMKFVDKEGEVQEGTFMAFSDGVDLAIGGENMKAVNDEPFEGDSSWKGLKQMADLQVLDYICGNVDRHSGNMMYRTDDKGNIVGVQGIDNDSSFGLFAEKEKNRHALPGADHLNVISASMRKKVMGLTPAMLKYSLRGRGLSEEKLEFAAKRLTTLQTSILEGDAYYKTHPTDKAYVPGHLRTVPDKEFQKLKIGQLYGRGEINLFSLTHNAIQRSVDQHKGREKYAFDPEAAQKLRQKELPRVNAVGRGFTGGNFLEALRGASKLVEDKDKKFKIGDLTDSFRGSSPQWDEMEAAARKVAWMEQELLENPNVNITVYNARRAEIDAAVEQLQKKNDAYLAKKMGEKHVDDLKLLVGKNKYEKARIDHSLRIKAFTDAYKKPPELGEKDMKEMKETDMAEFRMAANAAEMQDKQEAYKLLQAIHRKHGLAAPEKMKAEQEKLRSEEQKQAGDGVPVA